MKIYFECLPCILRQAVEASKMATDDLALQEKIIEETLVILENHKNYMTAPEICRDVHRYIKKISCKKDIYHEVKTKNINSALKLYPHIRKYVEGEGSIERALKVAAIGNVMDAAMYSSINIDDSMKSDIYLEFAINDTNIFIEKLKQAKSILVIGDNAGESVFDKILIEHLPDQQITYAVRSQEIINDVTVKEARKVGINKIANVISSGCDAPGTILNQCSKEFLNHFNDSDIIISKGQGNFESLSETKREIFFLLKAKCDLVASILNVRIGEYIFKSNKTN